MDHQPIYPISIERAIRDIARHTLLTRQKLHTLIQWYIYPEPTPNAIKDIEPRLAALERRLLQLSYLSTDRLALIIDDSDALEASFINLIVDQLMNAVHGIHTIFTNHYDRGLEDKKPFQTIYKTLELREKQLKDIMNMALTRPGRFWAEDHPLKLRQVQNHRSEGNEPGSRTPTPLFFCRGAVQMINRRDKGKLCAVDREELGEDSRATLTSLGGAYLAWECPECSFKLQFHVASSISSNIHATDEFRTDPSGTVEYRGIHLVKCHLYQPRPAINQHHQQNRPGDQPRGPIFTQNPNTVSFEPNPANQRNRSSSRGPSQRRPSLSQANRPSIMRNPSLNTTRARRHDDHIPKFGCLFCFATGSDLSVTQGTAFPTQTGLATHLADEHSQNLFPSLMMQNFAVGVKGKKPGMVMKWDLNFL